MGQPKVLHRTDLGTFFHGQSDKLFAGAVAGDWESGAIAWVAAHNGVRCLILRGVTDLIGPEGGEGYGAGADVFHERAATVMARLFADLPRWLAAASFA